MKNKIIVLLLISLTSVGYGQRDIYKITSWSFLYNVSVDYQIKSLIKEKDRFKEHQVKSREFIQYANGEKIRTTQFFNTDGLVTKISREIKGKVHGINYSYDENNNVIEIHSTNSKNEKWRTQYFYDKENRLIGRDTYDNKGEYSGFKSGYDNAGKILFQELYTKSKTTPVQSLFYNYYEGGSKNRLLIKRKVRLSMFGITIVNLKGS